MKKFFKDFKKFITRGNVVDMAVGVIIGSAFSKIVTSLVNDIIMPLITWGLGASSLDELSLPLRWEFVTDETTGELVKNITLSWKYGNFLQTILDFLIIAFCIFLVLRIMINAQNKINNLVKENKRELSYNERKQLKKEGYTRKQIAEKEKQIRQERLEKEAAEKRAKEEAEKNKPTTESILLDIKQLLAENTASKKENE